MRGGFYLKRKRGTKAVHGRRVTCDDDDDVFCLFLQKQKLASERLHTYRSALVTIQQPPPLSHTARLLVASAESVSSGLSETASSDLSVSVCVCASVCVCVCVRVCVRVCARMCVSSTPSFTFLN